MKKFIRIAPHVTAKTFGCDHDHFEEHIKNKVLSVDSAMKHTMFVKDDTGESWTVFKEDAIEVDVAGKPLTQTAHA